MVECVLSQADIHFLLDMIRALAMTFHEESGCKCEDMQKDTQECLLVLHELLLQASR